MARRFGDTKAGHRATAARMAPSMRMEFKITRGHAARGECRAAIRGLSMTGYAAGKYVAERAESKKKGSKKTGRIARDLFALADRIARACVMR